MQKGPRSGTRLIKPRKPGIDKSAPFYRGETAEKVVADRVAAREAEALAKQASRPARKTKTRTDRPERRRITGDASMRVKTPEQRLKRLERALTRRKTVAGRESVAKKIRELKLTLQNLKD